MNLLTHTHVLTWYVHSLLVNLISQPTSGPSRSPSKVPSRSPSLDENIPQFEPTAGPSRSRSPSKEVSIDLVHLKRVSVQTTSHMLTHMIMFTLYFPYYGISYHSQHHWTMGRVASQDIQGLDHMGNQARVVFVLGTSLVLIYLRVASQAPLVSLESRASLDCTTRRGNQARVVFILGGNQARAVFVLTLLPHPKVATLILIGC